jgi:dolichol-phosphate mannosyltransferase
LPEDSRGASLVAERFLDVAVVIPTYNERENVAEFISVLESALQGLRWELVFVDDDSPDGTGNLLREIARRDSRIRLIQRIGRRGLSSACIEGMLSTSASHVAVMDADLQHDERILPQMLSRLREGALDVVVGTRNAEGGSMGDFSGRRVLLSRLGRRVSQSVCRCELTDPMSGFFIVRRAFFLEVVHSLHGGGFKILVDILASSDQPVKVGEVGYRFRNRQRGESKLDLNTGIELLFFLANKITGGFVPARFAVFALVGATGLAAHFLCLTLLLYRFHMGFTAAQSWATVAAMTENFFLNNLVTYRDRSLHGLRLWAGLASFGAACSFGAWANVSFAHTLLNSGVSWALAALAGIVLGSVWNYTVSSLFTWQTTQPIARPNPSEFKAAPEPEAAAEAEFSG